MAGLVGRHDMGTRTLPFPLLNQVGQRLIDRGLELPPFAAGQIPHRLQDLRIDLGREFLTLRGGA